MVAHAGELIASLCANHGKKYAGLERKQVGAGAAWLEELLGADGQAHARAAAATAASIDGQVNFLVITSNGNYCNYW